MATQVEILSGRVCPYCGNKPTLVDSTTVYGEGHHYGPMWACMPCQAWVGCHKGTDKPLGRLATKELRDLKKQAHDYFDPLWKKKVGQGITRTEARKSAYSWLAKKLGVSRDLCHIGMFDEDQCRQVIIICRRYYPKQSS